MTTLINSVLEKTVSSNSDIEQFKKIDTLKKQSTSFKIKIKQEKLFGLLAILISFATLISLVYQNQLIVKTQKAAVFPYIDIYTEGLGSNSFAIILENKGTGPAIITDIKYSVNGKSSAGNVNKMMKDNQESSIMPTMNLAYSDVFKEGLVSAGERVELLKPLDSISSIQLITFLDEKNFNFTVSYRSIYDNQWITSLLGTVPLKLEDYKESDSP